MGKTWSWRYGGGLAGLLAAYVVAGKIGLALAFIHPSASPVWAPTGIALAGLLLLGLRAWPVILLGAFLVNVTGVTAVLASLGIAAGNTLEALLGSWLLNRYARGKGAFERPGTVFLFVVVALFVTMVSAVIGTTSLVAGGYASAAAYGWIWLTWWLGDAVGAMVVTPVVLCWVTDWRVAWSPGRLLEAGALLIATALVSEFVFAGLVPGLAHYPVEFLVIPCLVWAAFRFGMREAATLVLFAAVLAIHGTLLGYGPFARDLPNAALLLLLAFAGVAGITTYMLAAVVAEHRRIEQRLRALAVTDPLTGLANYRRLMDVLETEIERSGRTGRPFTVLFLDVDGLKRLNDRHGHLVGSAVLCRVGAAIQLTCRTIDTAARFGGDEFTIVLPETVEVAAWGVAERIRTHLANDPETPPVTVSIGLAEYPRDAATVSALLNAADRHLYRAKAQTTN